MSPVFAAMKIRIATSLKRRSPRKGVTLIEILLVLAILAALAGLAAPSFESMITSRRINNSTDQLVNELAEARVTAMKTGQAQVFKATLGGREYSITPWLGGNDSVNASGGATIANGSGMIVETDPNSGAATGSANLSSDEDIKEISEGVQFSAVDTVVDTRNAAEIQSEGGMVPVAGSTVASAAGSISSPVLLYPDGSSTTAQIILADEKGRRMAIQLRGVTGQLKFFRIQGVDPGSLTQPTSP